MGFGTLGFMGDVQGLGLVWRPDNYLYSGKAGESNGEDNEK